MQDILENIDEEDLVSRYFGVKKIPSLICSPLRKEKHPSFRFYYGKNNRIRFKDFATGQSGGIIDLFKIYWECSMNEVLFRLGNEINYIRHDLIQESRNKRKTDNKTEISCMLREWNGDDEEYWKGFGISIPVLKYANVHPVRYFFINRNDSSITYKADRLSYGFYEFKEGHTTVKIYQPENKCGVKWRGNHDASVVSLWTKVPSTGKCIAICSSLKDALCLWENTGIPSLAIQGEAFRMSSTAINELKRRFKYVFICLDNDNAGIENARKLAELTGFINVVLPLFDGGKDISDYYKSLNDKNKFKTNLLKLFKDEKNRHLQENQTDESSGKDSEEVQP